LGEYMNKDHETGALRGVRLLIPHSPMVYVKLPKTVLVLFHLFRATKLPIFPGD
jgi:hypothetical protein